MSINRMCNRMSRRSQCCWSRFIAEQLSLLVVLCATVTSSMTSSSNRCEFPAHMTRMSNWKTQVSGQGGFVRNDALWTFPSHSQAKLIDLKLGPPLKTSLFDCHTAVNVDTFLTSIAEDGATGSNLPSYQCLRFVRLSDFVVQLAKSDVFDSYSPDLCSDPTQLIVQDLVLVYPGYEASQIVTDTISCGLTGRYWLSVVDKSTGSHKCRDSFLRPVIEADCVSPGEGVLIDFRQPTCAISSADTSALYNFVCLGAWTQSGFNYSVLTDNKPVQVRRLWMLKIPEVESGPMTAYLMRSLTTGSAHSTGAGQYKLSLTPASFPTLCENEANGCVVSSDCEDDAKELHCQRTCNACTVTTSDGAFCQFNDSYHGQWLEVSHRNAGRQDANRIVTVTNSTLQVATQPAWKCIEFSAQQRYMSAAGEVSQKRPVAMVFDRNGCRPRLACVEILRRSNVVIQYRVSRHITWPVADASADVVCSDDKFTEQHSTGSRYQFLVSREEYPTSAVACDIGGWYHMNGSNSHGQRFEGYIKACGSDDTVFSYVTKSDDQQSQEETHRCLATFTERIYPAEFTYIITAGEGSSNPSSSTSKLFCWLLEKSPSNASPRMYLSYAADCYRETAFGSLPASSYIAQFELISSEAGQEWIRNCSSSDEVPVHTPGLTTARSTPGLASTTLTVGESSATSLLASTATAAALLCLTLILINFTL